MFITDLVQQAARENPSRSALVHGGARTSWSEFAAGVARAAGALRDAGVAPGERVAVLAANSPALLEMCYAVMWCGAVLVPLNTRLAVRELARILGNCEAGTLVQDSRLGALADALAREAAVPRRIHLEADADAEGVKSFGALKRSARPIAASPGALAALYYTGGTTGLPKGVMLSHQGLRIQAQNIMATMQLDSASVFLHAMPLFHVAGTAGANATTLAAGTHAFMSAFDPAAVFARIRDEGVDTLSLAPTMFAALLDSAARDDAVLERVRTLCYGAAPITSALLERLLTAFPNARIQQYYGQTECAGACLVLPSDRHVSSGPRAGKLHTAGHALPSFEVRVVDAQDRERPRGEPGEIAVAGPGLMQGYWRDPQRTAEALRGGWLHTGDVGVMDEEGLIAVVDRLKDMIVTGGENVYSTEVENAISAHPDVAACAVVGLPDERWGEAVHAVVVPRAGSAPSAQQIIDFCRGRIAAYKCPKSVTFRTEPLPLSGVGKVQKNVLCEQLRNAAT